jgi:hypothetical protein
MTFGDERQLMKKLSSISFDTYLFQVKRVDEIINRCVQKFYITTLIMIANNLICEI